jgi:hypothetical protein
LAFVLCFVLHRLRPDLNLPTLLLYSTCLNDIEYECEFHKYDCLMHVEMVVLKVFDDDHVCELDHNQVYSTRTEGEFRVCAASLSLYLSFSLWSRATVITVARGLSDDLCHGDMVRDRLARTYDSREGDVSW